MNDPLGSSDGINNDGTELEFRKFSCSATPPMSFTDKSIYNHTGGDQFFDVSTLGSDVCWIKIKAWGAGGGGSFSNGGAGGYVETFIKKADLPNSLLLVVVGSGGNRWNTVAPSSIYGGGGKGGQTSGGRQGSSGGGLSGVFDAASFATATQSSSIVISGAGAGTGKDDNFVKNPRVHGVPGGGLMGLKGGDSLSAGNCKGGQGGTQTAGGVGGAGTSTVTSGEAGSLFQGGNGGGFGLTGSNQGGGGGGYFGGGGGCGSGSHPFRESGGGSGSSFISSIDNGDGSTVTGNGLIPPMIIDLDYIAPAGEGGGRELNGSPGLIVIEWK